MSKSETKTSHSQLFEATYIIKFGKNSSLICTIFFSEYLFAIETKHS